MSAVVRYVVGALVFLAIGVAVALAIAVPQRASATHSPVISYVQRGIVGPVTCSNYRDDPNWDHLWVPNSHPCWHNDEPEGTFTAIDYPKPAGTSVYFSYFGDFQHFKFYEAPPTSGCTGVEARLYWQYVGNETFLGKVHYLHLDPAGGVIGKVASSFEFLGSLRSSEPFPCTTTGPHLHQSADDLLGSSRLYFNRWENPDRDKYHEHTIYWPYPLQSDADSDLYSDNMELRISTDPQDNCPDTSTAWDEQGFDYNEPVSPWPPDFDDNRFINLTDVSQILAPVFGSTSGDPYYYARRDLNGDGVINITDVGKLLPPVFGSSCAP